MRIFQKLALAPALLLFAVSPHFVGTPTAKLSGTSVVVSFKEAGLGANQNITYTASADASATYACINGGGNHPQAANKETITAPVSSTGTFNSGQNGNIAASLTLQVPGPGLFACPGGQTLVLAAFAYSSITITDTTNNVTSLASPSSLSATLLVI